MAFVPAWFYYTFIFLFGLIIGSFLNVVIVRLPTRSSIVSPPSHCPTCEYRLKWYDNFPVLSYLALRGKCRLCRSPISIRYPIVEILTGVLFLAAALRFGLSWVLFVHDFPFLAILIAVTFIDLQHRLIPDPLSLGGLTLGLVTAGFVQGFGWIPAISGAVLGFVLFYGVAWYYQWRTGNAGMGGGDVKLLAMLGAFVGPAGVITTILFSSILGSLMGITYALIQKRRGENLEGGLLKVSIPFGPFLVIGAVYYYLLGEVLWSPFTIPM